MKPVVLALLLVSPALASAQVPANTPLTLGVAARLAASRGTEAVTAREQAIQRGARSIAARADLLPSLSTAALIDGGTDSPIRSGADGGMIVPDFQRTVDMQLRVSQRIFDLSALGHYRATVADAEAAKHSGRQAAESAAEEGALSYISVLRARARLEARIADSTLAAELLDMAKQQLAAGTAIALDVTRAESQLASATSELIGMRNDRNRTELELLRVLALPIDSRLQLADSLRPPEAGDVAITETAAVQSALLRRGDVLAAGSMSDAARREIGAIKSERLPSVALFAQAGSNAEGVLDSHTYGVQVSLPIFDGFRREARVAEARAKEREAEARWQDAKRRTEVEVRTALLDIQAAREQVVAAGVQLRLAEQEVSQARERFRAGVAGNADVITASLTLNDARDVVVNALTAYHVARVGLASARGMTTSLP